MGYSVTLVGKQYYSATVANIGGNPVVILTNNLPDAQVGVAYTATLLVRGGKPPYTWSVTAGSLPIGLSLSSDGVISGTPTGVAGLSSFTVTALDGPNTSSSSLDVIL